MTPAKIKAIREYLGISQDKLARILNVSTETVKSWEQGRRNPSLKFIEMMEKLWWDLLN